MDIKTQDITKTYRTGGKEIGILDEVNIDVPSGAFAIIFGASGAGKTTILSIISGIELATSGRVLFDKQDLMLMSERERAEFRLNQIGFIFQNFNLIPSLTVRENVAVPLVNIRNNDEVLRKTDILMEKVGISHRADNLPDALSFGERQRVAIARAIANNPKLVLADEPTSNLEDESAVRILQLLHKLNQEEKVTVILATNSAEISRQECNQFYRFESNRLKRRNI